MNPIGFCKRGKLYLLSNLLLWGIFLLYLSFWIKKNHFLLNKSRYSHGLKKRTRFFEPFGSFTRDLLKDVRWKDLLFARLPREAVVFRNVDYVIVDIDLFLSERTTTILSD